MELEAELSHTIRILTQKFGDHHLMLFDKYLQHGRACCDGVGLGHRLCDLHMASAITASPHQHDLDIRALRHSYTSYTWQTRALMHPSKEPKVRGKC